MIEKISDEKRRKIKEHSAFTLPIRPSEQGMSPEQIKKAFYGFVTGQTDSVIEEINRIVEEIDSELGGRYWFPANKDTYINAEATVAEPAIFDLDNIKSLNAEVRTGDMIIAEVSTAQGNVSCSTERIGFARILEIFGDNEDTCSESLKAKYQFIGYLTGRGITSVNSQHDDDGSTNVVINTHEGSHSFKVKDGRPIFYSNINFNSTDFTLVAEENILPKVPQLQLEDIVLSSNGLLGRVSGYENDKFKIISLYSIVGPQGVKGDDTLVCFKSFAFSKEDITLPCEWFNRKVKNNEVFISSCTCADAVGIGTFKIKKVTDENVLATGLNFVDCRGKQGAPFKIAKTFISIEAMNAGYATDGVDVGCFVAINTGNENDEDNAKLFYKGDSNYEYIVDMSGLPGIHGADGKGISGVEFVGIDGLAVTYRITFTDDSAPFDFVVNNGHKGDTGDKGDKGLTALQYAGSYVVSTSGKTPESGTLTVHNAGFNRTPQVGDSFIFVYFNSADVKSWLCTATITEVGTLTSIASLQTASPSAIDFVSNNNGITPVVVNQDGVNRLKFEIDKESVVVNVPQNANFLSEAPAENERLLNLIKNALLNNPIEVSGGPNIPSPFVVLVRETGRYTTVYRCDHVDTTYAGFSAISYSEENSVNDPESVYLNNLTLHKIVLSLTSGEILADYDVEFASEAYVDKKIAEAINQSVTTVLNTPV